VLVGCGLDFVISRSSVRVRPPAPAESIVYGLPQDVPWSEKLKAKVHTGSAAGLPGPTLNVYEAKAWRKAEAIRHVEAAVAQSPGDVEVLYKRAVVYALVGREADAARSLEVALAKGYSRALVRSDDDLSAIVRLPRMQELLKDVK
jgi:hypothetical protein